ncbi:hypothetical protein CbuD7E6568_04360 [Coxiella burnetii]|uniref:putative quinol monooxygenase n=1 Tax=Coxiella burnetii TaxID=777 RepID=UPI000B951767|nr:putative quinol monooxygenase [Coxiella burnetii]OYK80343.1 hypothetical protein CbuD7E6568_04360 [Coxiella burnetii]
MSNKYYTIIVFFKAKPGQELALKEFLTSIVDIALQSPDCIRHDLHQSLDDPGEFMFYENWIHKKAHEQHIARPEVKKWRSKLNDFLEKNYDASFWEII